tara:strand:- start:670 stop:843 length:174 start_codon:yes stop_codon:yes gene_type:complete
MESNLDTKLEGVRLIYEHSNCTDPVLLATAKRVLDSASDLERDIRNLNDYIMKAEAK